ncbi:monocarboxylate transporter 12-B [Cloeon dipterum]|uniref:monocarboxylate transporter 12-B n=1 Tax=Cloeon dipterum TaxID=197152 RepID=UPI0032208932
MTHPPSNKRANGDEDDDSSSLPPPPDGGWGWWVVFGSFMIHIVADGVTYSFGLFIDEFIKYFGTGSGETAWIASILVGVTLCSGPITSSLVNKYGCRPVTIAGAILSSFCLGISIYAPSVAVLYLTIGLGTGFGFGLIYLPAIVSVTCYFERLRSLATGIAVCGSGLGTFIYAPLIRYLIATLEWKMALLIVAISVLGCVFFGALFRPLEKINSPARQAEDGVAAELKPLNDIQNSNEPSNWRHSVCNGDIPKEGEWGNGNGLLAPPTKANSCSAHDILNRQQSNDFKPMGHVNRFLRSETERMTMSHPALLNPPPRTPAPRHRGPMDRPDVFYRGSLVNIPFTKSASKLPGSNNDLGKNIPMIIAEPPTPVREAQPVVAVESAENRCCGMSDTMKEMLDFSVLKNPVFILFTVSNFCTSVGFNIPYVYIKPQANSMGIEDTKASMLLAVIGIANTVGRIILGYLSDKPWVNRLQVYNWCLTICGISTMASVLCYDFTTLVLYTCVWGFTIGAYVGLTSVILVDLLGLEMLTNAFGVLLLFQGIASLLGPPIAGWLYDGLHSYNPGFLVSGVAIAASGVMLFAIPMLQRSQLASRRP